MPRRTEPLNPRRRHGTLPRRHRSAVVHYNGLNVLAGRAASGLGITVLTAGDFQPDIDCGRLKGIVTDAPIPPIRHPPSTGARMFRHCRPAALRSPSDAAISPSGGLDAEASRNGHLGFAVAR
jgi:DNA-binding transcriptional LysR family regulator